MSTHYVARVVVEKIERPEPAAAARGYERNTAEPPKRTKTTVASVTISAQQLGTLKESIGAHMALVEDGGEIE